MKRFPPASDYKCSSIMDPCIQTRDFSIYSWPDRSRLFEVSIEVTLDATAHVWPVEKQIHRQDTFFQVPGGQ